MSLNNFAMHYLEEGNYVEAEPFFRRSLVIIEKAFRATLPNIVVRLQSLGKIFLVQNKYSETARHLRRSLEINERALGPNHSGVAASLDSLAALLLKTNRQGETGKLHEHSLTIRVRNETNYDSNSRKSNLDSAGSILKELAAHLFSR